MTQEHREQFLATEGWQQTERGHVRGEWFWNSTGTGSIWVTNPTKPSVKFRRFPFGRQPKHDALVGWFATDDDMAGATLTEQWKIAAKASDPNVSVEEWQGLLVDFWIRVYPRNKRQGWDKNGEVMG